MRLEAFETHKFVARHTFGTFAPQLTPAVEFNAGGGSDSVAIGDLTGDDVPDLVIANLNINTISILVNKTTVGSATPDFYSKADFATGDSPVSVVVIDVDADGRPDLAVANLGSESVSILRNALINTALTPVLEALSEPDTGPEPNSVIAGDLNGDGQPDLVTANRSASVSILLGR